MSGCRSAGCSAVVSIGSSGEVIAVAPSGAEGCAVAPSGAGGSSEGEPVIPAAADQPSGQGHRPLPVPVGDEPVELVGVARGEPAGGAPGVDRGPPEHPAAYGGR